MITDDIFHAIYMGWVDVVRQLLNSGTDPNITKLYLNSDRTPLMRACYWNNMEIVKLLLSYGADVNYKNPDGISVLKLAREYPNLYNYLILYKRIKGI